MYGHVKLRSVPSPKPVGRWADHARGSSRRKRWSHASVAPACRPYPSLRCRFGLREGWLGGHLTSHFTAQAVCSISEQTFASLSWDMILLSHSTQALWASQNVPLDTGCFTSRGVRHGQSWRLARRGSRGPDGFCSRARKRWNTWRTLWHQNFHQDHWVQDVPFKIEGFTSWSGERPALWHRGCCGHA